MKSLKTIILNGAAALMSLVPTPTMIFSKTDQVPHQPLLIIYENGSENIAFSIINQYNLVFLLTALENKIPFITTKNFWRTVLELHHEFSLLSQLPETAEYKALKSRSAIEEDINKCAQELKDHVPQSPHLKELLIDYVRSKHYKKSPLLDPQNKNLETLLMISTSSFNPSEWDAYTAGAEGELCLLLPCSGASQGFALNKLTKIEDITETAYFQPKHSNAIVDELEQFFKKTKECTWDILMVGHGMFKDALIKPFVTQLPLETFHKVIDLFDRSISVSSFTFQTCYAGGKNWQELFINSNRTYNFPIIVVCCGDYVTYNYLCNTFPLPSTSEDIDGEFLHFDHRSGTWSLKAYAKYKVENSLKKFFDGIAAVDFSAMDMATLTKTYEYLTFRNETNTSLMLPAGSSQTILLNELSSSKKISDAFVALKKNRDEPFTMSPEIRTIYLDTTCIDMPIIIENKACINFISLLPGDTAHYIRSIDAQKRTEEEAVFFFAPIGMPAYNRHYCIDEYTFLLTNSSLINFFGVPLSTVITAKDVLISTIKDDYIRITFKDTQANGFTAYIKKTGADRQPTVRSFKKLNDIAFKAYQKEYAELKQKAIAQSAEKQEVFRAVFAKLQ